MTHKDARPNEARPPEPIRGEPIRASMFPGSGFVADDEIDIDAMNRWAVRYGWECRFRETQPGVVDIYYPQST